MDVTCQSCRASYKVDDAKIPAQGIKARCPKCSHSFLLKKPDAPPPMPPPSDDVIAVGGDAAPAFDAFNGGAPAPDPFGGAPASDPFANISAAPADPFGGAPAPDPFGAAPAPPPDPFTSGFGGAPDLSGFSAPKATPAPDPFAAGGVFGSGFAPSAGATGAGGGGDIGGLFAAKTAFEVRKPDGSQIGPFDTFTLKQMIYEQQLNGSEELLDANGNWVPIGTVEDLGEILRLTGASGAPAAADGGAWGAAPEPAAQGWAKHDSVAKAPPPPQPKSSAISGVEEALASSIRTPRGSTPSVAAPPPPLAIEAIGAGKRGASEKMLIGVERAWASKGFRVFLAATITIAILSGTVWFTRGIWMPWFDLDKKVISTQKVAVGDRTALSGEKGPILTALGIYEEAVTLYQGELELGRLAETQATIVWRDPVRLDMKAKAESNLALAIAAGSGPPVSRARLRVALAKHDAAAIAAAVGSLAGDDPATDLLRGEAALETGDLDGAEKAFKAAAGGAAPAQANAGLARVRVKKGDFAGAKAAADAAVAAEPDNGLAKALAAFASTKSGGDAAAAKQTLIDVLANSQRFAMDRAQAAKLLAMLAEEQGTTAGALGYASQAVSLYPSDAESMAMAKRLFAARFPAKNVDAWIAAISKPRGSTQMGAVQDGERMVREKNWPGAQMALSGAVGADPSSARAHVAYAKLLVEVGGDAKIAEAKKEYAKAIELDAQWAEPAISLAKLEIAAKNFPEVKKLADKAIAADPTRAEAYQVGASAALALKDAPLAESYLKTAVELDPDSPSSWMDLGEALRLMGRPDEAIPHLERAATLAPKLAEPRIRLGAVYETKSDYEKAGQLYTEASALEPENMKVLTRAGVTYVKAQNYPDGRKRLEAAVKAEPSNAEAQYWLGIAHQFSGDPDDAIDDYKAALKHKYENAHEAHYHLGELYATPDLRDIDAARHHLQQAFEVKPDYWQARMELAKVLAGDLRYDEALKELKALPPTITKKPLAEQKNALEQMHLKAADIYQKQGKVREATKAFNDTLKVNPRSAPALFNLGDMLKETSPGAAAAKYKASIAARRDYAPPYKGLGDLDAESNRCRSAKANYNRFLELTTDDNSRKEVQAILRDLPCD